MGLWKGTKKVVGHMVDVRVDHWLDFISLKNSTRYYWKLTEKLFSIQQNQHAETFEEAVDRMALSKNALIKQSQYFLKLSFFFLFMTLSLVVYSIILYRLNNGVGAAISLSLSLYALSLAFRFHFWHVQISKEKLGFHLLDYAKLILPINKRKNLR